MKNEAAINSIEFREYVEQSESGYVLVTHGRYPFIVQRGMGVRREGMGPLLPQDLGNILLILPF